MSLNPSSIDITELYDTYYVRFRAWSRRHYPQYDAATHEDVFHDALIIYWENSQKGRFQFLQVPLINLLIGIGFNIFRNKGAKTALYFPELMPEPQAEALNSALDALVAAEQALEQTAWLDTGFQRLGEECQKLLTAFYYDKLKIPQLTVFMAYKNENVTSAAKSRCLKSLKDLLGHHGK